MGPSQQLLDRIWQVPAYLPYLQPSLTKQVVSDAESRLGIKLPDAYLALLERQNGGYIRYEIEELPHTVIAGIGPHYPTITEANLEEADEYVSFELRGLVPFDGDGHWHLCLDYRGTSQNAPSVSYIDIECDDQRKIAGSFEGYLAQLVPSIPESGVWFTPPSNTEEFIKKLAKQTGSKVYDVDTFAHGYPVHRLGRDKAWAWLSPNDVARGFVREEHIRFDELRDRLPGTARRYPELPDNAWIATSTDTLTRSLRDALASLGCKPGSLVTAIQE